jgi:hypothetical protein
MLKRHTVLEVESLDRMYLNLYVAKLQTPYGAACFFIKHRGKPVASSALMEPMTQAFVTGLKQYAEQHEIPMVHFKSGERKDDVANAYRAAYRRQHGDREGVVFIGVAQEKASVMRTQKRMLPTGHVGPTLVRSTAMVNQYYVYVHDEDFGPLFIKFCSYFPYTGKVCLNGHEYAKRQLEKRGIAFEPLDNGFRSCADPGQLQVICDGLGEVQIQGLVSKWLARLPHPFTPEDRAAGYTYAVSMLQVECALTQVLDRPDRGRRLFESIIREHLDLGRPDQVQLIFERRITQRTPRRFRTRVIRQGVVPSLHIDYKHSRLKQYHKEGLALRTETTINDTRDFHIGRSLCNLPHVRRIGFTANRRLLSVQSLDCDPTRGAETAQRINRPITVDQQRASALRFDDPITQALLSALMMFMLVPNGFVQRELRAAFAAFLGKPPDQLTPAQMTYHLRRLRLHGLIARIPGTHRYTLTPDGYRAAYFETRLYAHVFLPAWHGCIPLPRPVTQPCARPWIAWISKSSASSSRPLEVPKLDSFSSNSIR